MEITFKNKVAFITGASEGIGAAIAKNLAADGASVAILARRLEPLQKLEQEILNDGGKVLAITGDVSNPEDVRKAIQLTSEKFGGLHLAVNNAGIPGNFGLLHEMTVENWRNVLSVNLDGTFYGMKYEIEEMLNCGGGSIVNIGSVESSTIMPLNCAYTTSKHALLGLTKTAAYDYAQKGIRINVVSPGVINTPLFKSKSEISGPMIKKIPMGRVGESEEIADGVAFVLSDKAAYMTGVNLTIDGAWLLKQS
jgi:NAD(P)-dependent dehydrogenase (short-subunit alcohol dehydrogenase family)